MVSYVKENRRGGRSLLALLVTLAVATVGVYLAAAATAKPAEAVSCSASSQAPQLLGQYEMAGQGLIYCSGNVKRITVTAQLQRQNANGGWSVIRQVSGTVYGDNLKAVVPAVYCSDGGSSNYAYYRTVTTGFTIAGPYNYRADYGPKYSLKKWLKCSGAVATTL